MTSKDGTSLWTDFIVSCCIWFKPLIFWLRLRRALIIIRVIEEIDTSVIYRHLRVLDQNANVDLIVVRFFVLRFKVANSVAIMTLKTELESRKPEELI